MLAGIIVVLPQVAHQIAVDITIWLKNANQMAGSPAMIGGFLKLFVTDMLKSLGMVFLFGAIAAIVFSLLHAGPVFSFEPLKLDLSKLNPVNGLKKIFSKKGLFEILKLVLKLVFIGVVMIFIWNQIKNSILYPDTYSISSVLLEWKSAFTLVVTCFLMLFFVFALFDLWFTKKDFANKMRMSTRDIKDEYKRKEGDPEMKHKRKKGMFSLMKNIMGLSQLKNADVVVTNPTHVAVALQYRAETMALPKLITKGKGFLAQLIIRRAKFYGIPVVRVPPLARSLFKECEVNSPISLEQQYEVAKIYRSIIKMQGTKVFNNA